MIAETSNLFNTRNSSIVLQKSLETLPVDSTVRNILGLELANIPGDLEKKAQLINQLTTQYKKELTECHIAVPHGVRNSMTDWLFGKPVRAIIPDIEDKNDLTLDEAVVVLSNCYHIEVDIPENGVQLLGNDL